MNPAVPNLEPGSVPHFERYLQPQTLMQSPLIRYVHGYSGVPRVVCVVDLTLVFPTSDYA